VQQIGRSSQGHVGQLVTEPLQLTFPSTKASQLLGVAVQLPPAPVKLQLLTEPSQQVTWALQDFGAAVGLAAKTISPCGVGQAPVAPGSLRIMARASSVRGATLGVWAAQTAETKAKVQARIAAFFMSFSFVMMTASPSSTEEEQSLRRHLVYDFTMMRPFNQKGVLSSEN
jgi:hypothetical protein